MRLDDGKNTPSVLQNDFAILHSVSLAFDFLLNAGCDLLAATAGKILPGDTVQPKYLGLAGQSVGVMVWTDRGVQLDYPTLSLDLANSVQHKLLEAKDEDELKKSTFPLQPASIVRYQEDHPDLDVKDITEVAPRLGVSRLIYVEVEDFGMRRPAAVDLFSRQHERHAQDR